jgi:hypothetical protein
MLKFVFENLEQPVLSEILVTQGDSRKICVLTSLRSSNFSGCKKHNQNGLKNG